MVIKVRINVGIGLLAASLLVPSVAMAAGYAINEQSASATGTANAGAAANPENASILYFNPAGMTKLSGDQVSFGLTALHVTASYNGTATNAVGQPVQGTTDQSFVPMAYVPNVYYTHQVNQTVTVGIGAFSPFGLSGKYPSDFVGRYFAEKTSLLVGDVAPSIALDSGQGFSIGAGLDFMYAKGILTRAQDFSGLAVKYGMNPNAFQPGYFKLSGDDWGIGWNIGVLWEPTDTTNVGITYRSPVKFKLRGDATLSNVPNPLTGTTTTLKEPGEAPITTPESLTFSVKQGVGDGVSLLAGATWTRWSRFPALDIYSRADNAGSLGTISQLGNAQYGGTNTIAHVAENWKDVWAWSLGVAWQATPAWQFKAGYAYDSSPIPEQYRTARIPSADRNWITLGSQWKSAATGWSVDAAVGYLMVHEVNINEREYQLDGQPVPSLATYKATYKPKALGLGVQVSKAF